MFSRPSQRAASFALATAAGAYPQRDAALRSSPARAPCASSRIATFRAGAVIVAARRLTPVAASGPCPAVPATREVMAGFEPAAPSVLGVSGLHLRALTACLLHPAAGGAASNRQSSHRHETVAPPRCDRTVPRTTKLIRPSRRLSPAANGLAAPARKTCLYNLTPDGDFLIDRFPWRRTWSSPRPAPPGFSSPVILYSATSLSQA